MKEGGGFERLTKNRDFTDRVISVIFDEAHCISAWGGFRPEYREVGRLKFMLPKDIPIMITSATLPQMVLKDVKEILGLRSENLEVFRRSSDRPNVHLFVRPIINSLASFADLAFLLRDWKPGDPQPLKFLIFFDDINESVRAGLYLKSLLPPEYRHKINWFNSTMSNVFKNDETISLETGDAWGLLTTDSFGMVSLTSKIIIH